MLKIKIDNIEFLVKPNISVLEACKFVGIDIPRFCYHETLSVAGNCRMCLVEVEKSPKPVASCALPVSNNMQIYVDTPLVKKARENVVQTLLLNHPLDCPICDQGGECDLQDQTKLFGGDYSRFFLGKRGVEDKECGPLIKTIMTRCIHCTRCVRFGTEIAGVEFLGTLNRGTSTEIGGYVQEIFNSEISGNVIDLCPVGALTSKSYAFKARPWEIRSNESVDLTDSTGSSIYVNFKESEIIRILPKNNLEINKNIISDKARFSYDSVKTQRLQKIFQKNAKSEFEKTNWKNILHQVDNLLNEKKAVLILVNEELDFESLNILRELNNNSGGLFKVRCVSTTVQQNNFFWNTQNDKIKDLENRSNNCFLISSNIRLESSIINTKIRNKYLDLNFKIFSSGLKSKSNFPTEFFNLNLSKTLEIFEGKNSFLSKILISFQNPILLFGNSFRKRFLNFVTLFTTLKKVVPTAIILDLKSSCNSSGIEMLGIKNVSARDFLNSDAMFAINLNDVVHLRKNLYSYKKPIFWFNTHGSELAKKKSTFIIPTATAFEEEGIFHNLENRPQKSLKTLSLIGDTRSVKDIVKTFNVQEIEQKREASFDYVLEIIQVSKLFTSLKNKILNHKNAKVSIKENKSIISLYPLKSTIENFYVTNKFTRYSPLMVDCSKETIKKATNF